MQLNKGNGRPGKLAIDNARFINDEENGCRFEVQRNVTWIYMRHAWLIAVRERVLSLEQVIVSFCMV